MDTWTVRSAIDVTYRVREVTGVFDPGNDCLARSTGLGTSGPVLIVTDRNVQSIYGDDIRAYMSAYSDTEPVVAVLEVGEAAKSLESVYSVVRKADEAGISRRTQPILAIGGGVVTDVAGLAASLYRRGTPFVRVPTTLIGIIDAAVGVKNGVNFDGRKNRLGTYFPASETLVDAGFINTLPPRHVASGLAEAVKMGIVLDELLFDILEAGADELMHSQLASGSGREVIRRSIRGMLSELEGNLWEHDLRRLVDFGHTFSPAIEMKAGLDLLHGEAVAIDMAISAGIAHNRGLLTYPEVKSICSLLRKLKLPLLERCCTPGFLASALDAAALHRNGKQHLPLPKRIGSVAFFENIEEIDIRAGLKVVGGIIDEIGAGR